HVPERVVRLLEDRPLAGSRHDQVGFDLRQPAQALEQPDTVDHAGRAGDRHDQPLHSRNRRRRTSSRVFWYITSHSPLPSGAARAAGSSLTSTCFFWTSRLSTAPAMRSAISSRRGIRRSDYTGPTQRVKERRAECSRAVKTSPHNWSVDMSWRLRYPRADWPS